jgi:predicted anti-sigma-YlaC factor YlaD
MGILTASHEETAVHLSDLIDLELSGLRRRRIERHLRDCEGCRALLRSLTSVVDRLRDLARDLPPQPQLADEIVGRLRAEGAP